MPDPAPEPIDRTTTLTFKICGTSHTRSLIMLKMAHALRDLFACVAAGESSLVTAITPYAPAFQTHTSTTKETLDG